MLTRLHRNKAAQLAIGFALGVVFGFLLQKGGVTRYDVILSQLLLIDFTVLKIMLAAVITGMLGVHLLVGVGMARLHPKAGSLGSAIIGGLLFGVGFALLGYCPGTLIGAVGEGWLDALVGGVTGTLLGSALFAALYPRIAQGILARGDLHQMTLPQLLGVNAWVLVVPLGLILAGFLWWLEEVGL